MAERGIIFNAAMIRAVLDGRKTQTRRVMKGQPPENWKPLNIDMEPDYTARTYTKAVIDRKGYMQAGPDVFGVSDDVWGAICPFGQPGDHLWVRETFRVHSRATDVATLAFRASKRQSWTQQTRRVPIGECNKPVSAEAWTPSIHMPRWASRIELEITSVGVQRLQALSPGDAVREGLIKLPASGRYCLNEGDQYFGGASHDAREVFSWLWSSIYGEKSWQANPWVWVIEFKRVEVANA